MICFNVYRNTLKPVGSSSVNITVIICSILNSISFLIFKYRGTSTSRKDDRLEYYIPLRGPLPPSELPVKSPVTPRTANYPGHRTIQMHSFPKVQRRSSAPARLNISGYCFRSFHLKSCLAFSFIGDTPKDTAAKVKKLERKDHIYPKRKKQIKMFQFRPGISFRRIG